MYRTIIILLSGLLFHVTGNAQLKKYHFSETKMGSSFNIIMMCDDSLKAVRLAKESFALVDSLTNILSDYDSTSELSRLCAHSGKGPQPVSSILWNILLVSKHGYEKSRGSFDISVGALSHLWRKARKDKVFPDSSLINAKKRLVGLNEMILDTLHKTVTLLVEGMILDLGGIGKGFAAQQVVDYLLSKGIDQSLADAGGDMAMSKAPVGTKGWVVGVNIPETTDGLLPKKLLLHDIAVATSGDAYQFIEHNGKKYSHIIDPRTGYGISSQRNVTVIAANGTDADWLTKACSILPIPEAKRLVTSMHGELLITVLENGKIIYYQTKGFDRFWKP